MKILWIINTILPSMAKKMNVATTVFGGWLNSLYEEFINNDRIKQMIIVSLYNGVEEKKCVDGKIIYYLIPVKNKTKYYKNLKTKFINIYNEEKPDLVHIHGTEYPHSLSATEACVELGIKSLVSIQGLVSIYGRDNNYFAGLTLKERIINTTVRDLIKNDLLLFQALKFRKRGKYEEKCLKLATCVTGRTSWDEIYTYNATNKDKYMKCNESLRRTFYGKTWNINNVQRHTIFVSQASYPIKGFHKLLVAANLIKRKYPDLKILVAGNDIIKINNSLLKDRLKLTGYGNFLRKMIKKYRLNENVEFLGVLDEQEMLDKLLISNVFVQASSIENSPNSLGEAMILGMPCVASYVGGTADMLKDKQEGLLYPFNSPEMLAKYVMDIFDNDTLATSLGHTAQKRALRTHCSLENSNQMISIYKEVIK